MGIFLGFYGLMPRAFGLVSTQLFARTMAFDPKTKNIYLLTAEFETVPTKDPAKPFSRKMRAGSFCVLVIKQDHIAYPLYMGCPRAFPFCGVLVAHEGCIPAVAVASEVPRDLRRRDSINT
jgi:hypothetical protein